MYSIVKEPIQKVCVSTPHNDPAMRWKSCEPLLLLFFMGSMEVGLLPLGKVKLTHCLGLI